MKYTIGATGLGWFIVNDVTTTSCFFEWHTDYHTLVNKSLLRMRHEAGHDALFQAIHNIAQVKGYTDEWTKEQDAFDFWNQVLQTVGSCHKDAFPVHVEIINGSWVYFHNEHIDLGINMENDSIEYMPLQAVFDDYDPMMYISFHHIIQNIQKQFSETSELLYLLPSKMKYPSLSGFQQEWCKIASSHYNIEEGNLHL